MTNPRGGSDDLQRLSYELLEAIRTRNSPALHQVLDQDFVQVNEAGGRLGKLDFINAVQSSTYDVEQLSFEFLTIEIFATIGVVCGVQRAVVRMTDGTEVSGRTAFTDVFIRDTRGWRLRMATSAELAAGE